MTDDQFVDDIRATLHAAGTRTVADTDLITRLTSNARSAQHEPQPRRAARAWAGPLLIAAAVVALVALTAAPVLTRDHHRAGTSVSPGVTATMPTSPTLSTPTRPAVSTSPTHSPSAPPAAVGPWSSPTLTITDHSLGAVTRGMSKAQVEAAAGLPLRLIGDGIYQPSDHTATGATTLITSWGFTCFDATNDTGQPGTVVATPAGVRLGDPMSEIAARYGNAARSYSPDPSWSGPGNLPAGVMVTTSSGVLLFIGSSADHRGGTIITIRGSTDVYHASSMFC